MHFNFCFIFHLISISLGAVEVMNCGKIVLLSFYMHTCKLIWEVYDGFSSFCMDLCTLHWVFHLHEYTTKLDKSCFAQNLCARGVIAVKQIFIHGQHLFQAYLYLCLLVIVALMISHIHVSFICIEWWVLHLR